MNLAARYWLLQLRLRAIGRVLREFRNELIVTALLVAASQLINFIPFLGAKP